MSRTAATILVRPFRSLSDDVEHEYFARGFLEDLFTQLGCFKALEVLTENGSEHSVDYELQGSIRAGSNRVRVNAQLLEVGSGRHLWAGRFDSAMEDPFDVQDEIASSVAGSLATHVDGLRLDRARRAPVTSLATYDLWLRGRECLERGTTEADLEARALFERAIELDPQYSRAYAGLSLAYYNEWSCQSWHLWNEGEAGASTFAEKAVELDDGDAMVHVVLGRVYLYRREFERGRAHLQRALGLNPNDPDVLASAAMWNSYLGELDEGLDLVQRAMELNPRHGTWYYGVKSLCLFGLRRYDMAVDAAKLAAKPFVDITAFGASALAYLGTGRRSASMVW